MKTSGVFFFRSLVLILTLTLGAPSSWAETAVLLKDSPPASLLPVKSGAAGRKIAYRAKNPIRTGIASWYSETDAGINRHTANGEVFDDTQLTCASWDYSFGTLLEITNRANGKTVVCRVNDRGPAKRLKRLVDLSKGAFKKIENPRKGLTQVSLRVLPKPTAVYKRAMAAKKSRF